MADKKIIGTLENLITFNVSKDSLTRALKDIRRIKKAMQEAVNPVNMARKTTQKAGLFNDKMNILARNMATSKEKRARREQRVNSETEKLNRAHTQAIIEDRKRTADAIAKIQTSETKAQKKAANEQNALNKRNKNRDESAQATTYGFRQMFGRGGARKASALYDQYREGKLTYAMYNKEISLLRNNLFKAQRAQRGFNQSIHDMRGAFIQATASYTAFAGVMAAANIGKQYESRYAGMLVGTGSAEQARSQISYLDKEVYRLGLDIGIASQGLVQMSVAANGVMSNGQIQGLFTGLSELSTAVKLDPFRYEKAIMAISQMLNKGQLMA